MADFSYFPLNHAGVHGFLFSEGAFIYSDKAKAARALNALSCWLLLQLEDGVAEQELMDLCLSQNLLVSSGDLQREITQLKALQQGDIETELVPDFVQALQKYPLVRLAKARRGYDVSGLCVCIEHLPEALKPYLSPVLLHRPMTDSAELCLLDFKLQSCGAYQLWLNKKPWQRLLQLNQVAPMVLSIVRRLSVMQGPSFATAHAGLVDVNSKRWLFSGLSGAGKSTLCAQLLACGQQVLTDELVLFDNDGNARAVPLALGLKQNSWPLLNAYLPLDSALENKRLNDISVKYLALSAAEQSKKIDAWCFVAFDSRLAEDYRLSPLTSFESVQQLFNNGLELGEFSFDSFVALLNVLQNSSCYELRFKDSAEAARFLSDNVNTKL